MATAEPDSRPSLPAMSNVHTLISEATGLGSDSSPTAPGQALSVLWGKSKAGPPPGSMNLLIQHLLDAAAVGELVWDRYLAPAVREKINRICRNQGRQLLSLLCGLHDVGKATPAFQWKDRNLAARVRQAGLTWRPEALPSVDAGWHHTRAGAVIMRDALAKAGWSSDAVAWVLPLIAGHHGIFPETGLYGRKAVPRQGHGKDERWRQAQAEVVSAVLSALAVDLSDLAPDAHPARAVQMAMSGAIIMADWIASGEEFPGVSDLEAVTMPAARKRAERAWDRLGLCGGWRPVVSPPAGELVRARFGRDPRGAQSVALAVAESMPTPGLLLIEAPTGEGKTEAALAAAELLARRFGLDGAGVFMPTQATSDAMFRRVLAWAAQVDPDTPVGLLHGKCRFNPQWRELYQQQRQTRFAEIDPPEDSGSPDPSDGDGRSDRPPPPPAFWFLGPKRGLLMPVVVATVDQLLYAATRTRHVMLRHFGLSGRVVILDEVHAYDVYMGQFIETALRWLGDAGVPVVLLSATLPPDLRRSLVRAYLQGATRSPDPQVPPAIDEAGYPGVVGVGTAGLEPWVKVDSASPWRRPIPVSVEVLQEAPDDEPSGVVALVEEALRDGGRALIVRNAVSRAQKTYAAFRKFRPPDEVILLHAQMCMGERNERVAAVLRRLDGRTGDAPSSRLIVVATQIAEQSFDVDADLLVTDLAPIDLILQRVGRLHRHDRPDRPSRVKAARVVIGGARWSDDEPPILPAGSERVYGRHPLLRAAALVREASRQGGWSVPADVPELVRRGYGTEPLGPAAWQDAMAEATRKWQEKQCKRKNDAKQFLLDETRHLSLSDLGGLHSARARDEDDPAEEMHAMVRDGNQSIEAVPLRRDARGYVTLSGRSLGINDVGVNDPEIAQAVLESALRLPSWLSMDVLNALPQLAEWADDPWLKHLRVLELDGANVVAIGKHRFRYDDELGLVRLEEPAR